MLKKRIVSALWGIPLVIAAVWFEHPLPWFTILVAVGGVLAAREFYRLAALSGTSPLTYFGLTWTLLFILSGNSGWLTTIEPGIGINQLVPLLLTSAVLIPPIWLLWRPKEKASLAWVWTLAGILYIGWLLSYLVTLRGLNNGRNWVLFVLLVTFASDTAAFFIGRAFGKHHLAPQISPGKTWEGTIGGIVGAVIVSLLFTLPTPVTLSFTTGLAVLLGFLVSVFGQLGDLVESLFKRNMGVKDSGGLIPGHGGILDRIDSLLFASVVVYYYLLWATP